MAKQDPESLAAEGTGKSLLSVVVPLHSADQHLEVLHASLAAWFSYDSELLEVILCDDGTSPAALKASLRLARMAGFHSLKHVTLAGALGPGLARNAGMRVAQGRFLYFADSDDLPNPEVIQEAALLAASSPYDVVQFGYTIREWDDAIGRRTRTIEPVPAASLSDCLEDRAAVWRFVFRREFVVESAVVFPPLGYAEDLLFLLELSEHEPLLGTMFEPGYEHRFGRPTSASTNVTRDTHRTAVSELVRFRSTAQSSKARWLSELWLGRIIVLAGRLEATPAGRAIVLLQDMREVGWRGVPWVTRAIALRRPRARLRGRVLARRGG